MSDQTPLDPSDPPAIPEGLATKLGKYGALLAAVFAALAAIFDVEVDTETLAGFAGTIVLLVTTMWGRYKQAEAMYRDQPSVLVKDVASQIDEFEDFIEDAPTEDELKQEFPEDAPTELVTPTERPE